MHYRFFPILKTITIFLGVLLIFPSISQAQQPPSSIITEAQIQSELDKRGIGDVSPQRVLGMMQDRGFNPNNVDPTQQAQYEALLDEVAAEILAEKAISQQEREAIEQEPDKPTDDGTSQADELLEEIVEEELLPASSGPNKKVYGPHIFIGKSFVEYQKNTDVKPRGDYILGQGDEITVALWGASQYSRAFVIGKDGYIKPERMPRIYLKGLTYDAAVDLLKKRFRNLYTFSDGEYAVTLNFSRNIQINVVGSVNNPGPYQIPATNNIFTAMIAAHGPDEIGSVREVKLFKESSSNV